jgi:hypothetical protein
VELSDNTSIIAVGGLGSHPFGSFKQKDAGFMWLRDEIAKKLPNARILIWGYRSPVIRSNSFRTLEHISQNFKDSLQHIRKTQCVSLWSSTKDRTYANAWKHQLLPRPTIFIGHSMGGLIVKQVRVSLWHEVAM